jgi:16S rRNA (guanine527-N7)-methyltransferase
MDIASPEWARLIADGAAPLGVATTPEQVARFASHAQLLLEWNAVTNLTTITRPEEIAVSHFLDSLAAHAAVPAGSEVLDVGSGGGFPGLPLRVMLPDLRMVLLDAARKKVSFLRHVIRTLGLKRVQALHARVEALGGDPVYRGRFDVVVSRAYAGLSELLHSVVPLVKPGGRVVALKGVLTEAELADVRAAGAAGVFGAVLRLETSLYHLPGLDSGRMRVVAVLDAG